MHFKPFNCPTNLHVLRKPKTRSSWPVAPGLEKKSDRRHGQKFLFNLKMHHVTFTVRVLNSFKINNSYRINSVDLLCANIVFYNTYYLFAGYDIDMVHSNVYLSSQRRPHEITLNICLIIPPHNKFLTCLSCLFDKCNKPLHRTLRIFIQVKMTQCKDMHT